LHSAILTTNQGYYEVRDSRGGGIADLLDYNNDNPLGDVIQVWGRSRWGATVLSVPSLLKDLTCPSNGGPSTLDLFEIGFTPIGEDQHCTGLATKDEAQALCAATGANLCATQATVANTRNVKLGCGYDQYPIWSAADANVGLKYPRCCGSYEIPIDCSTYLPSNIETCTSYTKADTCLWAASGTAHQKTLGFGHAMPVLRTHCTNAIAAGRENCANLLIQTWTNRDTCIWCPLQGQDTGGGSGQCRPGNDYGICSNSDTTMQNIFSLKVVGTCGSGAACSLLNAMPSLSPVFLKTSQTSSQSNSPVPAQACSAIKNRVLCKGASDCDWTGTFCKFAG